MLNPEGSAPQPSEDQGATRAQSRAIPAPTLDPSWRAGRKLEEARRQRGLSYEQVSSRIRVRREYLEALEAMNVKLLPGKAYALAYLRSYARLLGLDETAIVQQFQDECALTREDRQPQIRSPESRPRKERPWIYLIGLLVLAVAFLAYWNLGAPSNPPQVGQASSPAQGPGPAAPPAATAAGAPRGDLEFRAMTDAWLEVRGPDGTIFLARTLRAGEIYRPDPGPGWTVHARDGAQFEIIVGGRSLGPLGAAGSPVLGRRLDEIHPPPDPPVIAAAPRARSAVRVPAGPALEGPQPYANSGSAGTAATASASSLPPAAAQSPSPTGGPLPSAPPSR